MASSSLFLVALLLGFLLKLICSQSNSFISSDVEGPASVKMWDVMDASLCSTTCGLGLRKQKLCHVVNRTCHERLVRCLVSWHCGLKTQTVTVGQHVELDCLEKVMESIGQYAFIVSWRYARGIITTNNRLFRRYEAPDLDRVVLNPVREEHAGTYLCQVLDASYRRVKRMYHGVKVLSPKELSLDFSKGLSHWEKPGIMWPNVTIVTGKLYPHHIFLKVVLVSLAIPVTLVIIILIPFFACYCCKKK